MFLQTEGKLKGCWVMPIDDVRAERRRRATEPRARTTTSSARKSSSDSNGTVTYVGKDMAYQFWKFGLLGKDFHYRVFETAMAADLGDDVDARRRTRRAAVRPRRLASTTSSTRASRICRSC